MSSVNSAQTKD